MIKLMTAEEARVFHIDEDKLTESFNEKVRENKKNFDITDYDGELFLWVKVNKGKLESAGYKIGYDQGSFISAENYSVRKYVVSY